VTYSRFGKKNCFSVFHFDMNLLLFSIVLAHCPVFRPLGRLTILIYLRLYIFVIGFALYGRLTFLCLSKEKSLKERIPSMPALRVPCDARMNRRDVKLAVLRQSHPEPSGSSCASRQA
jgi:hypothetical protein